MRLPWVATPFLNSEAVSPLGRSLSGPVPHRQGNLLAYVPPPALSPMAHLSEVARCMEGTVPSAEIQVMAAGTPRRDRFFEGSVSLLVARLTLHRLRTVLRLC